MSLLEDLLSKPSGRPVTNQPAEDGTTRTVEVERDAATITLPVAKGTQRGDAEGTALEFLVKEGQNPDEWEVTGFRRISYGNPQSPFESVRFTYRRRKPARETIDIDTLADRVTDDPPHKPHKPTGRPPRGVIIALGDMQYGKLDGDGVEGAIRRTFACIDHAAERAADYATRYDVTHLHVAFLGDHVEGFQSQGGANVWRTQLTLSEQIRLTRRTMLHALRRLAPLADKVTMAAVPGNHGETVRFAGKGVTRYDDSHDTESLVAVHDAVQLNPSAYGHVDFLVPETDEMTVTLDVAGTRVSMVHGHQFRPGKHWDWFKGQAFGGSPLRDTTLLLAGHLHHEHIDSDGPRTFVQVPALESESTWWRHAQGTTGNPGVMLLVTHGGRTPIKELIQEEA